MLFHSCFAHSVSQQTNNAHKNTEGGGGRARTRKRGITCQGLLEDNRDLMLFPKQNDAVSFYCLFCFHGWFCFCLCTVSCFSMVCSVTFMMCCAVPCRATLWCALRVPSPIVLLFLGPFSYPQGLLGTRQPWRISKGTAREHNVVVFIHAGATPPLVCVAVRADAAVVVVAFRWDDVTGIASQIGQLHFVGSVNVPAYIVRKTVDHYR